MNGEVLFGSFQRFQLVEFQEVAIDLTHQHLETRERKKRKKGGKEKEEKRRKRKERR